MAAAKAKKKKARSAARRSPLLAGVKKRLGRRVAELRQEAGLTQEALAEKAKIDPKALQFIEYGSTNVTLASLVGVAKALDVSLSELFEGV
jgi:transcriptional regulator with XRE-family HTH domain